MQVRAFWFVFSVEGLKKCIIGLYHAEMTGMA
jgi:hypothetical protein